MYMYVLFQVSSHSKLTAKKRKIKLRDIGDVHCTCTCKCNGQKESNRII